MSRRVGVVLALVGLGVLSVLATPALTGSVRGDDEVLPPAYRQLENPLEPRPGVIAAGRQAFRRNCADCHGPRGEGDGPAAANLDPAPADLRHEPVIASHSDAWLFHRMSEGKTGTAMPSWKTSLSEGVRWAIVHYLRTLPAEDVE